MKPKKTAKKTTKRIGRPDSIDLLWLRERFDKLERDHKVIVALIKDGNVSPELATQINRAAGLSLKIDRLVPDKKPTVNRRTT